MRKLVFGVLLTTAFSSTPALAEVKVEPFTSSLFSGCVSGNDIGQLVDSSNPISLLGSLVYTGDVLTPSGIKRGLVRQPLALPIITTDSVSPDVTTCEHNFSVGADSNLSFLGFALSAKKSDIYKVKVRLVARQKVSPVAQNGSSVQPWLSETWKPIFSAAVEPTDATKFWIFDNISIYLLDVERYKKAGGGLSGVFGLVTGGANYERDDSFKGTKLIVTGDSVPLTRAMFTDKPVPANTLASAANLIRAGNASELMNVQNALVAAER
jgi:hypothetical protein